MREGGRGAIPTSISIFDSYDMKTLWFKFGHVASKCQDFRVGMPFFQPFYEMKLKTSSFGILKPVKISWPNSNLKAFISKESDIEMLVGEKIFSK